MSGGVYGTLPNRRSAFTRLAGVAASASQNGGRWNATAELEDYARQYEDLYSRRMNHAGIKSGGGGSSNASSSANTGSNSNSSNGYWFHNSR